MSSCARTPPKIRRPSDRHRICENLYVLEFRSKMTIKVLLKTESFSKRFALMALRKGLGLIFGRTNLGESTLSQICLPKDGRRNKNFLTTMADLAAWHAQAREVLGLIISESSKVGYIRSIIRCFSWLWNFYPALFTPEFVDLLDDKDTGPTRDEIKNFIEHPPSELNVKPTFFSTFEN